MVLNGKTVIEILPLRDLYIEFYNHKRLTVFVNKGRRCVICNREGTLLLLLKDSGGQYHFDLYTDDFVLMTVDHITPKAVCKELGWSTQERESLDNKQPMCDPCNNKKDNKLMSNEEYKKIRLRFGYPHKINSLDTIRTLVNNEGIFSKDLTGVI